MKGLGQAFSLWNIVREVNLAEIRQDLEREPVLVLATKTEETAEAIVSALSGGYQTTLAQPGPFRRVTIPLSDWDTEVLRRADAVIYPFETAVEDIKTELEEIHRHLSGAVPVIILLPESLHVEDAQLLPTCVFARAIRMNSFSRPDILAILVPSLVESLQDEGLHLARRMPPLRGAVASLLISKTAKANAEFALLTNLPAFIPLVGNLVGATADFFVLTKNQIMMLYKLAGVSGRDISSPTKVYREILPVVGAGLIWRTIAREVSALVPVWAGAVPKIIIAYAGTFAIGSAANYYYNEGSKPSKEKMRELYDAGIAKARALKVPKGTRKVLDVPRVGSGTP